MELTFVGGVGGSLGRAIVETYFSNFIKVPTEGETFMSSSNVNTMNSDSATRSGSSGGSRSGPSTSSTISQEYANMVIKDIQRFTGMFMNSNKLSVDTLI